MSELAPVSAGPCVRNGPSLKLAHHLGMLSRTEGASLDTVQTGGHVKGQLEAPRPQPAAEDCGRTWQPPHPGKRGRSEARHTRRPGGNLPLKIDGLTTTKWLFI